MILLDKGDELLPWRETVSELGGYFPTHCFEGRSHRFEHMGEALGTHKGLAPEIKTARKDGQNNGTLKKLHREERSAYPSYLSMRFRRSLSWLQRAEQLDDPDSHFIFLWIAFNAAYATEIS